MDDLVRTLDSLSLSDAPAAGSKAAVLGTLRAAGFPVPPGLCVTTRAFELALSPYSKHVQEILGRPDLRRLEVARAAEGDVLALLDDLTLPAAIASALDEQFPPGAGGHFAVRSSATAEDLAGASFAGQYATLLGVPAGEPLHRAVLDCWRSFFSPNAIAVRAEAGISATGEAMAVLVQPVVEAECAGVCFTVDPVQRRSDLVLIDATWGLGLGAVDGSLPTDTVRVRRADLTVESEQVADKPEQIALAEGGGGVERAPVDTDKRGIACLPEAWAQRVAEFGLAAEQLLGRPQDLEWAIADGQVWILQSRPVTSLDPEMAIAPTFPVTWESPEEARAFWTLSAASKKDIPLPLEHDYQMNYRKGWEEGEHVIGVDNPTRYKVVNGRRYWAGVPSDLSEADRRVRMRAVTELNERFLQDGGRTAWDVWGPEVVAASDRLRAFHAQQADGPALADHLEEAFAVARRNWMVHNLLGPPPVGRCLALYGAITGHEHVDDDPGIMEAAAHLAEGEDTVLTRLIDWLYRLAVMARKTPTLEELVLSRPHDVLEKLAALPEAAEFRADLGDLLEMYGVRTGVGFGSDTSLRTPTWREQPELVLQLVAAYLDPSVDDPALARARARRARDAEVEALCAACDDPELVSEFRRQLGYVRKDATLLEEHNHYIDQMATGQMRHAILAAGSWLAAQGLIADPGDVFRLRLQELLAVLRGESKVQCEQIVAAQRQAYEEWGRLTAPLHLGVPPARLPARPPAKQAAAEGSPEGTRRITGKGASPGRQAGRARIVSMGTLVPDVASGDVLIAENAGPLWTPIFPILNGLVLDAGAVLGHASTMAREYGVPAVVATRNATQLIPDGAWVTIDGAEGTVEIEGSHDA